MTFTVNGLVISHGIPSSFPNSKLCFFLISLELVVDVTSSVGGFGEFDKIFVLLGSNTGTGSAYETDCIETDSQRTPKMRFCICYIKKYS